MLVRRSEFLPKQGLSPSLVASRMFQWLSTKLLLFIKVLTKISWRKKPKQACLHWSLERGLDLSAYNSSPQVPYMFVFVINTKFFAVQKSPTKTRNKIQQNCSKCSEYLQHYSLIPFLLIPMLVRRVYICQTELFHSFVDQ